MTAPVPPEADADISGRSSPAASCLHGSTLARTLQPLSQHLRSATAELHRQAEVALDFPACVQDRASYIATLAQFYGLYEPLDQALSRQHGWTCLGLNMNERSHSVRLARDLIALGAWPSTEPALSVGWLTEFPQALGALYVLEGSTLGGQIILRRLEAPTIDFPWDVFGERHPAARPAVEEGATLAFQAIVARFTEFHSRSNAS